MLLRKDEPGWQATGLRIAERILFVPIPSHRQDGFVIPAPDRERTRREIGFGGLPSVEEDVNEGPMTLRSVNVSRLYIGVHFL